MWTIGDEIVMPKKEDRKPAASLEERENRMVAAAMDLAEKQLLEGTASAQVITHFLKIGSSKERLERDIMGKQKDLISAKTQAYKSADEQLNMYKNAIRAMGIYSGEDDPGDDIDI